MALRAQRSLRGRMSERRVAAPRARATLIPPDPKWTLTDLYDQSGPDHKARIASVALILNQRTLNLGIVGRASQVPLSLTPHSKENDVKWEADRCWDTIGLRKLSRISDGRMNTRRKK